MGIKDDQLLLIQALQALVLELGRVPIRNEFVSKGYSCNMIADAFGGYAELCRAAGLEPNKPGPRRRITTEVFNRSLTAHLEQHAAPELPMPSPYEPTLFIPDTHFPFEHQPTLQQIYAFAAKHKPKVIVQLGDLYDAYSHAKFPRSHNIFTPKEEAQLSRKKAEAFWQALKQASPQSRCIQLVGNHDVRPLRRILEVYPEAEDWIAQAMSRMVTFDGVETVYDSREELHLPGNVTAHHGFLSRLGQHRDYTHSNVVCGHTHTGGVVYRQLKGQVLWELNAGLAGDPTAKGLSYTPIRTVPWTLGWGWLDEYGPRFIPATR